MLQKNASQVESEQEDSQSTRAIAPKTRRAAAPVEVKVKTKTAAQLTGALYYYQAIVRSVYDGDTITVDIDLGMHLWLYGEKVRLLRINAPELKGKTRAKGEASRDFLRSLVDGKEIVLESFKDDREKYGRFLGEIWVQDGGASYINVNDRMVKEGFAIYQEY